MPDPLPPAKLSRRQFMGGLAVASAAFQVVPGHVLGLNGATPPSGKLNIAGIGVSGQGAQDLDQVKGENIAALCDVDWAHAAGTFKKFPGARQFKDYRKMLEQVKDLDAVVVATPDHSHALASMMAIKLGKHVYCEKPLTHSVWEARQVAAAARAAKVATQMGNQAQASENTRQLCELIWAGTIGPVREVHIWTDRPANGLFEIYWPQGIGRPQEHRPTPDTMDWDLWLGPAPARPYHEAYAPFRWRGWWDFGTGALGDIGCHTFDPAFRALKLGHPLSVQATSTPVNNETFPLASMVSYEFPARGEMPPMKLTWYDGGLRPARPAELEEGRAMDTTGQLFVGDKGKIMTTNRAYRVIGEAGDKLEQPPKSLPRSPGHYIEWINACKGGPAGGSNFDWAGPLTEVVLLGNVALRLALRERMQKHKLLWNGEEMRVTNVPEANEFLRRSYRRGWEL